MAKRTSTKTKKSSPGKRLGAQKSRADSELSIAAKLAGIDKKILWQALLIMAAGLWVFWPALNGDWLWDDYILVTNNSDLRNWSGLRNIWLAHPITDYWPLSWTVLWVEWHLWGNHPLGYHLLSLALHLGSGFLVWRILNRLGLRGGWIGGLLFVIYPLMVESVAWISEIKNTLSLPLFLLSFDAWLDGEQKQKNTGYVRSVLYYLAAMLAKTSTVMLPLVLLLYGWWRRGTISRLEMKKIIPHGIIALVLGLVTVYFQSHGSTVDTIKMGSWGERVLGAGMAICFYLGKFLWPVKLLPIYPGWVFNPPSLAQILPIPLLTILMFGLWTQRKSWGRHALFGFGFFALNLLPILGLVKMKYLSIAPVADHFLYLPIIGLIGLVVAGAREVEKQLTRDLQFAGETILTIVLMLLAWESHRYAEKFIDPETLWTYELRHNPQTYAAHNNLGNALEQTGRVAEAIKEYQQTLLLKPDYAVAYYNLGNTLLQIGRTAEAVEQYTQALQINPDYTEAHNNLGFALQQTGHLSEAIKHYEQSLQLNPDNAAAHNNLGLALLQTKPPSEAIEQFEQALQINPDYAEAHNNLGIALRKIGRIEDAIGQYEQALKLDPNDTSARDNLERLKNFQQISPDKK